MKQRNFHGNFNYACLPELAVIPFSFWILNKAWSNSGSFFLAWQVRIDKRNLNDKVLRCSIVQLRSHKTIFYLRQTIKKKISILIFAYIQGMDLLVLAYACLSFKQEGKWKIEWCNATAEGITTANTDSSPASATKHS